jgi:hypothetical protein
MFLITQGRIPAFQRILLPPSFRVKAAISSETLVSYHITIWSQNPDDHDLNHHHENLKSNTFINVMKDMPKTVLQQQVSSTG